MTNFKTVLRSVEQQTGPSMSLKRKTVYKMEHDTENNKHNDMVNIKKFKITSIR